MLAALPPIDNYIICVYKEPERFCANSDLLQKVSDVVDLIKARLFSEGISKTCAGLREELWELRWDLLSQQHSIKETFSAIKNQTDTAIAISNFSFDNLQTTIADSLALYAKLFIPLKEKAEVELPENPTAQNFQDAKAAYRSLKVLSSSAPSKELDIVINWIESSLDLECSLLIAEMIITSDLSAQKDTKFEVAEHLKNSALSMALYSAIMGFWQPEADDETPYVRNVKILLADYELRDAQRILYSLDELKKVIAA